MLRNLSYRYKVPLSFGLAILLTGAIMSVSLLYRNTRSLQQDLVINAQQLAEVLARTLGEYLQHDAVWDAYQLIRSPARYGDNHYQQPQNILVLDNSNSVFVATDGRRFPMLAPLGTLGSEFQQLEALFLEKPDSNRVVNYKARAHLIIAQPVRVGDSLLGHIIILYDSSLFTQQLVQQAIEAGMITLLILAALLPLGWLFGNRIAQPLVKLTRCMSEVGKMTPAEMDCKLIHSNDEIGRLSQQFREMLRDIEDKQALEKSMLVSDRLAAIGRLVAGIAHEINNPLAGMLNAIDTYKKHGGNDPLALRTVSLLERGLEQIRTTVSALIVEARITRSPLTPHDIGDIHTLIIPEARKKSLQLAWVSDLDSAVDLPSSLVRQVLLNLALNAIHASPEGGVIHCHITHHPHGLQINMRNDSDPIPAGELEHLFEPFVSNSESGTGLGLWVTYQIIEQLGGKISITTPAGQVVVDIQLPVQDQEAV